jgi:class 3 adenylate cyclase
LYADISGFTAMSEALSKLGREGAEELTKVINTFFEPLIDVVLKWHGDIYRFGGDAILAAFWDTEENPANVNAIMAAKEAIDIVNKKGTVKTSGGTFKVKMHIGIISGNIHFQNLKTDFFLEGVIHTATNAVETARRLVDLFQQDEHQIQNIGRSASTTLRVFHALRERPVLTLNKVCQRTGLSYPAASKGMRALEHLGIVQEITGRKRNRVFMYDQYLAILNEGTGAL